MAKKRKTLPKNFQELANANDLPALKAVFDKCDLNAYGGYGKWSAIAHPCSEEFLQWLVEQGADLHRLDGYGDSALHAQAGMHQGNIEALLKLGADITLSTLRSGTALHAAARSHHVINARLLLEYGADINAKDSSGRTPLELALINCSNINIENMAELTHLFFANDAQQTLSMKEHVTTIGERFEFHREGYNPDKVAQASDALDELYKLFDVQPVAKRTMHDGTSEIVVKTEHWRDQYNELWDTLIPSSGPAQTVQGEVIRIAGRIADEIQRNGGANWNADYTKMGKAFVNHISSGEPLPSAEISEARLAMSSISKLEAKTDQLIKCAVTWVTQNTQPTQLLKPSYDL